MPLVTDQLGRQVDVPEHPQRIVSLVPSQTELLYDLGLDERVVGITKFCVHPDTWFREKTRVGGTKDADPKRIRTLRPDLIIANKEENSRPLIERLAADHPVWVSDVNDLESAQAMINEVANLTNSVEKGTELNERIAQTQASSGEQPEPLQALYLIWNEPIMAAGKGTFIDHMMQAAGFDNVLQAERYPKLEMADLEQHAPQVVLYSSEPFPFAEKHIERFRKELPNAAHLLVDGEAFSWYGSRIPWGMQQTRVHFREARALTCER